jgi:hypothetical protein
VPEAHQHRHHRAHEPRLFQGAAFARTRIDRRRHGYGRRHETHGVATARRAWPVCCTRVSYADSPMRRRPPARKPGRRDRTSHLMVAPMRSTRRRTAATRTARTQRRPLVTAGT